MVVGLWVGLVGADEAATNAGGVDVLEVDEHLWEQESMTGPLSIHSVIQRRILGCVEKGVRHLHGEVGCPLLTCKPAHTAIGRF